MLKFTAVLIAISLSACSAQTETPSKPLVDRDADIATLTDLKKIKWRKLYDEQDADGLADFLADDFVLIASNNVTPKKDEVDWLRNNEWAGPADFLYTIEDIVFITDDAAIIYGRGSSTRSNEDGTACAHTYISSNTLRREGNTWRPVSSHVSDSNCELIEAG